MQATPGGDAMTDGLILLAFLGILAAFATVKVRKRMGIASNAKTWYTIIIGVVLVGLTIWAASTH
jgi:NO-binding membrane sensor protein with MHYT domain